MPDPHRRPISARSWAILAFAACGLACASRASAEEPKRPLILTHYMPWFAAKPTAPAWGWHWTMNAFDPETEAEGGRRAIAAHAYPLNGPYDSGDPAVVEYHFLLMKLAGIDGIVVDWYGLSNLFDYPLLHRNTAALFPIAAKLGLKVGICFEDQTIPRLVEAGKLPAGDRVKHAREVLDWLRTHWFTDPAYLRLDGRPVLLSFGADGLTDAEWSDALPRGPDAPVYLSEHRRRPVASGAFDWPVPREGLAPLDRFDQSIPTLPVPLPAAYPRFHDIYAEAKVHPSYGQIPDDDGRTFTTTLRRALSSRPPFVQVVSWNDWGEGTQVEPSVEFGYRDLEAIQRLRRELVEPQFASRTDDLRLAHRLYRLRGRYSDLPGLKEPLDEAARDLAVGRIAPARRWLDRAEADARETPRRPAPKP